MEIERAALCYKLSEEDKLKFAVAHLKDAAIVWYYNYANIVLTWNDFIFAFKKEFQPAITEHKLRDALASLKMKNSNIEDYNKSFREISSCLNYMGTVMTEFELTYQYQQGLENVVKVELVYKHPQTLAEAMELATWYTTATKAVDVKRMTTIHAIRSATGNSNPATRVGNQHSQSPRQTCFRSNGRPQQKMEPRNFTCNYCGKKNHWRKDCFLKQRHDKEREASTKSVRRQRTPYQYDDEGDTVMDSRKTSKPLSNDNDDYDDEEDDDIESTPSIQSEK